MEALPQPTSFAAALERTAVPRRVGDVRLDYDGEQLVGATERGLRSWGATLAWAGGVAAALGVAGALATGVGSAPAAALTALTAAAFAAAVVLEARDRRRRAFVLDFSRTTLRLDFVTPFVGRPRTLVVPFEAVRAVGLWTQADGARCLTVDFAPGPTSPDLLREVLAAHISPREEEAADRLRRLLEGAFGLGAAPEV